MINSMEYQRLSNRRLIQAASEDDCKVQMSPLVSLDENHLDDSFQATERRSFHARRWSVLLSCMLVALTACFCLGDVVQTSRTLASEGDIALTNSVEAGSKTSHAKTRASTDAVMTVY